MTDIERMDWVKNEQHLNAWHKQSRQTLRQFVIDNRSELDHAIKCLESAPKSLAAQTLAMIA